MPSIFIGTPTTKDLVSSQYAASIGGLLFTLGVRRIGGQLDIQEGYDVAQQRDQIAAKFLASKHSHLLFVDSDIQFRPEDVLKMAAANKEVIGAVYPFRTFIPGHIEKHIKAGRTEHDAMRLAHRYAFAAAEVKLKGEFFRAESVGAGLMLVSRECFERVRKHCAPEPYRIHGTTSPVEGFFQSIRREDGEMIPEDWSFCQRVREAGGDVWAYPFAEMGHVGTFVHSSMFADHLKPA